MPPLNHIPDVQDLDPTYELYEYACHESNYGLPDILKGARMDEKRKAEGAR